MAADLVRIEAIGVRGRRYMLAGATAIVLAAASVTAVAAAGRSGHLSGAAPNGAGMMRGWRTGLSCPAPALPGQRVTVMLADMAAAPMMAGGGMMAGADRTIAGRMMLHAAPSRVLAGLVSLVAVNSGSRTHELLVLPLSAGATVGARTVRTDGTVPELGSLGEASRTCGAGSGDGISAGSAGWVTLNLAPGRYELLCNLPGHYAAGMYRELDVR